MNAVNRARKLVFCVFRSSGSVCSVAKARCHDPRPPQHFTAASASSPHRRHVASFSCYFDTRRWFSDRNSESSGVFEEESHETGDGSSHGSSCGGRSSETFTLDVLVSLLRQENAVDLCVIKVPEQIKYTEYFIVVNGVSPRHLRAMALYAIKVYKFLKKDGDSNVKIEGKDAEDWMCIDFGNMVVHFMLPETREKYELEKLWTLRTYDEQLKSIPAEMLPEDFMFDVEVTK
ncbi:mitochondrial assembly of ribosomal large subunit protein 1 [Embiotoca jacksoni]|uniref:mitochondrial assembly of ribosomal large subunit protein 1 n=1 Tax=Embiotoca jacksoni TaxID=100190 RepID=UPI003703F0DF